MHLVGFIIRIFHDARSPERHIAPIRSIISVNAINFRNALAPSGYVTKPLQYTFSKQPHWGGGGAASVTYSINFPPFIESDGPSHYSQNTLLDSRLICMNPVYVLQSTCLSSILKLSSHLFLDLSSSNFTYTYLLTYLLTPWCRVLLEKLTGLQLVKKFLAFHGTRRFITALTSLRQLSLSWASPIHSIYPHPTSWRSILILSTHLRLGLPSGLFPSSFPVLCTLNSIHLIFPLRADMHSPQSTSLRFYCCNYIC